MMKRFFAWGVLVAIWMLICIKSYEAGTYLLGWDNLVPELNPAVNISRSLSTAWQEYQGVGLLGGMGHAADLSRQIILWVMSGVVPVSMLRWGWAMSMLLVGPLGMYVMGKKIFGSEKGALIGAMFYLLNPVTIQVFYVPFETFVSFYGFAPWMLWSVLDYLRGGTRASLWRVLLISLLGASSFVVQTMFVVYVMMLGVITLEYLLRHGDWVRVVKLWLVVLVTNLYWLLPVMWFGVVGSNVNLNAKVNQLATKEVELMNVAYGDVGNVMKLNGWWLQNTDVGSSGEMTLLMENWTNWLNSPYVGVVGLVAFGIAVMGILVASLQKKKKGEYWLWSWVGILMFVFVMLMRRVSLLSEIYNWMSQNLPLFGQLFRASYTKWSIPAIVVLGVGIMFAIRLLDKYSRWLVGTFCVVVFLLVSYWILPAYDNGVVGSRMKVELSDEYFELFEYFDNAEMGRIVKLPIHSLWGWDYTDWGYRGSGFLWYGIEQPILDRTFDVWSPYNEGFYNELSTAVYGCTVGSDLVSSETKLNISADGRDLLSRSDPECAGGVSRVLEKYDVRYVLLDESVVAPGQDESILRIAETKRIAESLGWERVFGEGFLTVWEVDGVPSGYYPGVNAINSWRQVEGETVKVRKDVIWEEMGVYVSRETGEDGPFAGWRALLGLQPGIPVKDRPQESLVVYPFADLMRESVEVEYGENGIQLMANGIWQESELIIPGFESGERVEVGYRLDVTRNTLHVEWEPVYQVNEQDGPKLANQEYEVDGKYLWVQIGDNEAVFVEEGKQVTGSARLVVGEEIEVKIYDGIVESEERVELVGEQKCGENGELVCYAIPLDKPAVDSLLQTVAVYEGVSSPEVCLDLEGEPYECVNERKMGKSPMVVTTSVKDGERYWLDYVLRSNETKLQEPIVRWYRASLQLLVPSSQWEEMQKEQRYNLQGDSLKVEVRGEPRVFDFVKMGRSEGYNCDVLERGSVEKDGGRYTADEYGSNCDYVNMNGMDTQMSYLMRMQGKNIEGRSVKLFLHNTGSKRNDLEYLLTPKGPGPVGGFDQTFSILPWEYPGSYSLNVETRSFGQYSENILEPVEVRWVPLEQIAGAKIVNSEQRIMNNVEIGEVEKTGTWLYRVGIQQTANGEQMAQGLVSLSQGFDDGWLGFSVSREPYAIRQLEHVKVNGWKNGWVISDQYAVISDQGEQEIAIFYWPQLLEYLGFLMLGVVGWWVWRRK